MISTILLSGGVGSRTGLDKPKQYCDLLGKEIICYCIDSIVDASLTSELVIVYGMGFRSHIEKILLNYTDLFDNIKLIQGGVTRQESVLKGLEKCSGDTVILHEAARPLITGNDILKVVNCDFPAVTFGEEIPFTVLRQHEGYINGVLKRDELFNVQLPQKFPVKELLKAHKKAKSDKIEFTDDSSLFFNYNGEVRVIKGSSQNIKITDSKDFKIAEEIIRSRCEY